jgi:hypothetical protein
MGRLKQVAKTEIGVREKEIVTTPIVNNTPDIILYIPTIDNKINYSLICDYLESDEELFTKDNLTFVVTSIHTAITKSKSIKSKVTLSNNDIPNIEYHLILKVNSMDIEIAFKLKERYILVQNENKESFQLILLKDK